jgi:hypothetical protein
VLRYASRVKRNTKSKGDISELMVMAAFLEKGYAVAKPFGENARYDFVAERDGQFVRVQVKSGWISADVVVFNCFSSHAHRGSPSRMYLGDADVFGIYCRGTNTVYVTPVAEMAHRGFLRLRPTKNGQRKGVRWAADYAVARLSPPDLVGLPLGDGVAEGATPS